MNEELSEFEIKFYKNFAKKFVNIYLGEGQKAAGVYAAEMVRKEKFPIAKPFVDEAFLERGFEVNPKEAISND
jgi:hypothetical protein